MQHLVAHRRLQVVLVLINPSLEIKCFQSGMCGHHFFLAYSAASAPGLSPQNSKAVRMVTLSAVVRGSMGRRTVPPA